MALLDRCTWISMGIEAASQGPGEAGVQFGCTTNLIRLSELRWPVIVGALVALVAFVPYVIDLFTGGRLPEGYGVPMTGILVGLVIAAVAIYCAVKQRPSETRWLLITAGCVCVCVCVFVLSLTGPRISAIAITLLLWGSYCMNYGATRPRVLHDGGCDNRRGVRNRLIGRSGAQMQRRRAIRL